MVSDNKIVYLMLIAGRKQKDELISALLEAGAHLVNVVYGEGTVSAGTLQCALGLVPEMHKVVITCVMTHPKADAMLHRLADKHHFNKPNTGIAFTMPIDKVSF